MKKSTRLFALLIVSAYLSICVKAQEPDNSCGLYLAHSDIFGRLGVYTAKALEKGSTLKTQDIIVPLIEDEGPLWNDQRWTQLLGYVEWEGRTVRALLAGTGGAVNLHSKLYNVEPFMAPHEEGGTDLHRTTDPGSGAFSYQVMQYKVTSTIPAGGQVLLNNVLALGDGITDEGYAAMDATISKLQTMFSTESGAERDHFDRDVLGFLHAGLSSEISDTFPANPVQFQRAKDKGTANAWTYDDTNVEVSWLKDNGVCLDNIIQDTSSVKQAGQGAFATRTIKAGSVVVPTPVIPVSRFSLEKYEDDEHQLLRNYCFGHEISSLLLCPYGSPATYANHARGEKANVKLAWSTRLDSKHEQWYNVSVNEILKHPEPGLVFELVATKDIKAGEEVFLDYGEAWDDEWHAHADEWTAPTGSHLYQPAAKMNQLHSDTKIKTLKEQTKEPYPANVFVAVRYHVDRGAKPTSTKEQPGGIIRQTYKWTKSSDTTSGLTRPVYVTDRRGVFGLEDTYTIELVNHPLMHDWDPEIVKEHEQIVVTGVPRDALTFVDVPFSSDHHMEGAFRSEIQIPYEIFPEAWIDLTLESIDVEDEDEGEVMYDEDGEDDEDYYEDEEL